MAEYMGELLLASATAAVINILLLFLRRAVADRPITGEPSLACVRSAEACGRPMRAGVPAEGKWPRGKDPEMGIQRNDAELDRYKTRFARCGKSCMSVTHTKA